MADNHTRTVEEAEAEFEQAYPGIARNAGLTEAQFAAQKPVYHAIFAQMAKVSAGSYISALGSAAQAATEIGATFEKGGLDSRAAGARRVAAHLSELEAACRAEMLAPIAAWADGLQVEASND